MSSFKVGIVAGAGEMPLAVVQACERAGRSYFVIAVDEFALPMPASIPHARIRISKIGASMAALKRNGCREVVFAGKLQRPDGRGVKLRPDWGGLMFLIRLLGNLGRHDDSLHRAIAGLFAGQGLTVVSPLSVAPDLGAKAGCLTRTQPDAGITSAFGQALDLAKAHGSTKRGQAIVFENGAAIAHEERAGTDAMLLQLANRERGQGFLVKAMAPTQLTTIDPPAIGESTIVNAAKAGLLGVLIEAGRSVIVNEERVRAKADELGLFVCAASAP